MKTLNEWWEIVATEYIARFIDFLPSFIGAILLLVIGLWVIKIIVKYMRKIFQRKGYDLALENFITTLANWVLKILLIVIVITQLGIETTSLVAAIGAAGLAIGLALQGSLANLAGGVLIIFLKPFKLGDWIEVDGISGSVKEISLFYTKLTTFGNQEAVLPNGDLSNDNIVNYSGEPIRRENLIIGISYDSDIKLAKETLMKLVKEQEGILEDPAPQILVTELADSSVNLAVRFFAPNNLFWDIHFYTIEEAKTRLEAAGIIIPFPQRDVHFFNNSEIKNGAEETGKN